MYIPKVAIIGRPNVGKSTLFNRLAGGRKAITSDIPKTTRDRITARIDWNSSKFLLIDTAGVLSKKESEESIDNIAQEKVSEILKEADLILFVIDGRQGITAQDNEVAKILRRYSDKVILVVNKLDTLELEKRHGIGAMGFRSEFEVSSITGRRCADLLNEIIKNLPKYNEPEEKLPVMTIIGRPNVGKSTLFNALVGEEISIVSEIPGTTRDSVHAKFTKGNSKFIIYDTAGYRKRGKIKSGIEKYSIYRTLDAIDASDLIVIVTDGSEGITRQDAHLVQLALGEGKKVIVVVNKIDKIKNESTQNIKDYYRYEFILKQTIVGVSALNKKNLHLLVREIEKKLII